MLNVLSIFKLMKTFSKTLFSYAFRLFNFLSFKQMLFLYIIIYYFGQKSFKKLYKKCSSSLPKLLNWMRNQREVRPKNKNSVFISITSGVTIALLEHAIFQLLHCYNCYKIIKFKSGVFPISQWSVLLKFLHIFILFIYSRKRVKLPSMYLW